MGKVFDKYATYYDLLYHDKNYSEECDFLERIFQGYKNFEIRRIVEIGCGTGGHLIPLAQRGYQMVGIDVSEAMLKIAKDKLNKAGLTARVFRSDARSLRLSGKFDAAICMFAVINYLTGNKDIQRALKSIRKHLKLGSLFIFDFWYGPAVLNIRPSTRIREIKEQGYRIIRMVTPEFNFFDQTSTSNYQMLVFKDGSLLDEIREKHVMRYLFPQEIIHHLEENGFKLLKMSEFLKLDAPPTENTWNVVAIAEAV